MADMTHQAEFGPVGAERPEGVSRAGMAVQVTGALLSVALLAGMGVWGYQLIVRDAHGVPVVRAMGGPMREAPESPGGELALHTGLAVNEVAAVGFHGAGGGNAAVFDRREKPVRSILI